MMDHDRPVFRSRFARRVSSFQLFPAHCRIFKNGRSQAVRPPAELRFDADEVFIRRDEKTGDVILSEKDERRRNREKSFSNSEPG